MAQERQVSLERHQTLLVRQILKDYERDKELLREIEAYKRALNHYIDNFGACCSKCENAEKDNCKRNCIQAIKNYFLKN